MINLSSPMFKVTIYQKCYHLSPDTLTSPLHRVSHSQGIIELCSEEWQLNLILSDSNFKIAPTITELIKNVFSVQVTERFSVPFSPPLESASTALYVEISSNGIVILIF